MTEQVLVGDIGGTNARLALCDAETGQLSTIDTFPGSAFSSLKEVINYYLHKHQKTLKKCCIGIACPVTDDKIRMTNLDWSFSIKEMQNDLNLDVFEVINDFTAVSFSVPVLTARDTIQIGGKNKLMDMPVAIFGAGTGLGVSQLIKVKEQWINIAGEGGHTGFAPETDVEFYVLQFLKKKFGHVSVERILSGPGLVNLYDALSDIIIYQPPH